MWKSSLLGSSSLPAFFFLAFVIFAWIYAGLVFAAAGPITRAIVITATIVPNCSVTNTPAINFGNYDPSLGLALQGNGTLSLKCSTGITAVIALNAGTNPSKAPPGVTRAMYNGNGNFFGYDVFIPAGSFPNYSAAFTTVWGDGSIHNGISTSALGSVGPYSSGSVQTVNIPLSGRIPANELVPPGFYSDTITTSITF